MNIQHEDSSTVGRHVGPDVPKLLVTRNRRLLQEFEVKASKVLIGRAPLNDLVMENPYVSKYHAMLIFDNNTMYLVDLKSANGVYVNSHRVRTTVLRHLDVIEIGNRRIKLLHRSSHGALPDVEPDPADTSIMKTVADMRRTIADKFLRITAVKRHKSN